MQFNLVLDWQHRDAKSSRLAYGAVHGPDTLCRITWQGWYTFFKEGRSVTSISEISGRPAAEVLRVYNRYFKEAVFLRHEYEEYRTKLATATALGHLPDDADVVLRFFVFQAFRAGLVVRLLTDPDHHDRIRIRSVMLDDHRCKIHYFARGHEQPPTLALSGFENVERVGIVFGRPTPIGGVIYPIDVLKRAQTCKNGTHVRVDPNRPHAEATVLKAA